MESVSKNQIPISSHPRFLPSIVKLSALSGRRDSSGRSSGRGGRRELSVASAEAEKTGLGRVDKVETLTGKPSTYRGLCRARHKPRFSKVVSNQMVDRDRASPARARFRVLQHAQGTVLRAKNLQQRWARRVKLTALFRHVTKIEKRCVLLQRLALLAQEIAEEPLILRMLESHASLANDLLTLMMISLDRTRRGIALPICKGSAHFFPPA